MSATRFRRDSRRRSSRVAASGACAEAEWEDADHRVFGREHIFGAEPADCRLCAAVARTRLDRGLPMTKRQQRFSDRVRAVVKKIPKGKTMTYKQVATKAGNPKAARAVGMIMSHNFDSKIPCHRVVRGMEKKRLQSRRLGT